LDTHLTTMVGPPDAGVTSIPVAAPDLGGNEEAYVVEALRSTWISSTGPFLARFEQEFAERVGAKHVLAVSNGTVGLHLAMLGLGIGPGDEVIVPSLTYIASANAIRYVGAEPVFVDVDLQTWCLDPGLVAEAITERTKAILPVHIYGHPADMDALNEIARSHRLWVIEDAAEAYGATYKTRPTGALGDIGVFSFYGNKTITCGEGGAVTVNDDKLAANLRMLRGQGMDPNRRYYFPIIGHNFRLTNVAAAILCAQLERDAQILQLRTKVYDRYRQELAGLRGIGLQPVSPDVQLGPWLFSITVDEAEVGVSRDELMATLAEHGVETRPFFIPIHELPPYRQARTAGANLLPNTNKLGASGLNLPTFNQLSTDQIDRICQVIARKVGQ
jgi:perosamine synthetase